jgi:hypothetical protein
MLEGSFARGVLLAGGGIGHYRTPRQEAQYQPISTRRSRRLSGLRQLSSRRLQQRRDRDFRCLESRQALFRRCWANVLHDPNRCE